MFAAFRFTLESGFTEQAIEVVLRSIGSLDKYVGQMRPFVDGSPATVSVAAPISEVFAGTAPSS